MANLGMQVYLDVPDIWVRDDVLDKRTSVRVGRGWVNLDMPRHPEPFEYVFAVGPFLPSDLKHADTEPQRPHVIDRPGPFSIVKVLRAVVTQEVDGFGLAEYRRLSFDDAQARCQEIINALLPLAEQTAAAFVEWVRVYVGQSWLPLTGDMPRAVNLVQLVDLDAGYQFGPRVGQTPTPLRVIPPTAPVTQDDLRTVLGRLESGLPAFPELSLADAKHMVARAERSSPERAVVLAAMACEAKIKQILGKLATDKQAGLIDVVLSSPREIPAPPPLLMHKVLKAINGRSLSDEDNDLFQDVEKLFSDRNAVVHRGVTFTKEHAAQHVVTASKAFAWMQEVVGDEVRDPPA